MAVTKIHPIKSTLKKALDYIENPDKTEDKMLVSSFGCSYETADIEFEMLLAQAIQKGNNLAHHLIQSFAPGEATPEQAHEIGKQLADEVLPWQINSTLIIFLYLHLSPVFLLKRLIFQGFPTFEFSFIFKVSSQIFSYFLMFFPAILVNPLVKQASLPTGFFNYSLSDILLPLHHQNSHGCKCSRLH